MATLKPKSNASQTPPKNLRDWLQHATRKTVTLDAMQQAFPHMDYAAFQTGVQALEQVHVLVPVKASGTDHGGLARKYTIHTGPLFAETAARIQQEAIHSSICGTLDLSWYMMQPYEAWQRDRAAIERFSHYLKALPCPPTALPRTSLQQRSYDIFGDEKFLLTDGGLLTRLHLSRDALAIAPEADPLMMAFHPLPGPVHHHLIVENKAPWMALFPSLSQTKLTSLILGYGWKICASIEQLPAQSGYLEDHHIAWYFGDFDWEGLRIWHTLKEQLEQSRRRNSGHADIELRLAVPFYRAFLSHPASRGKEQQAPAPDALAAFLSCIPGNTQTAVATNDFTSDRERFQSLLTTGQYYPQEALQANELRSCLEDMLHGT